MKKIFIILFCIPILNSKGQINEHPNTNGAEVFKATTLPNGRAVTYYMGSEKWRVMEKEEKAYYKEVVEKIRELIKTAIPKGWELDKTGYTGYRSETFYFTRSMRDDQGNRPNVYSWGLGIIPSEGNPLRDSITALAGKFQDVARSGDLQKIWALQQNKYCLIFQVTLNTDYYRFHSKSELTKQSIDGTPAWLLYQKGQFWMEKYNPSEDAQPRDQSTITWLIAGKLNQVEFNKKSDGFYDTKLEEKPKEKGYCRVDNIKIEITGPTQYSKLFLDKLNIGLLNEILSFKTVFP